MASVLTKPQGRIPLAWVSMGGQRLACVIDPEWDRVFENVITRIGGVVAPVIDPVMLEFDSLGPVAQTFFQSGEADDQAPMPVQFVGSDPTADDGRLQALEAQVAQLQSLVDGLTQGNQV